MTRHESGPTSPSVASARRADGASFGKVTVIIPLYNRAAFIGTTLASVLSQDVACALDVLVVDDGSTDDGPEIVADLAARHPQIRMVRTANQGVAKTHNEGLRHLTDDCDFVTFCDSDDVMPAGRLRADLAAFADDPALDFTLAKLLAVDMIDAETLSPTPGARTAELRLPQLGTIIFRKALMDRIGAFAEDVGHADDTDYLLRAFESGARYRITETLAVYYRQHGGNITGNVAEARRYFMMALRRSMERRKRGPVADYPPGIFGFAPPRGQL